MAVALERFDADGMGPSRTWVVLLTHSIVAIHDFPIRVVPAGTEAAKDVTARITP
jgi:hypothetical protein